MVLSEKKPQVLEKWTKIQVMWSYLECHRDNQWERDTEMMCCVQMPGKFEGENGWVNI